MVVKITRTAHVGDVRSIAEARLRSWQTAHAGLIAEDYLASLSVGQREIAWGEVIVETEWPLAGTLVDWVPWSVCERCSLPR